MINTLLINLYGGPGTGKSTTAAGLFSELKLRGHNVELVTEYAKDRVWEEHTSIFDDSLYILAKQHRRLERLRNKVNIIVTDSPLLLSWAYIPKEYKHDNQFKNLVVSLYNNWNNCDILLSRIKQYQPIGRNQTLDQAIQLDKKIVTIMDSCMSNGYHTITANKHAVKNIIKDIFPRYIINAQ
jgi:hypothetical protein